MKKFIVLSLGLLMTPALAHADQLRVSSYDMDDAGGTVRLESNAAIGEPWMRVDGKVVRIWFPHVTEIARFDHERSNEDPIRALQLRPGASETAVLRIELGSARRITPQDIEVSRHGVQASVALRVGPHKQPAETSANAARTPVASARPEPQLTAAAARAPAAPEAAAPVEAAPAALPLSAASKPTPAAGEDAGEDGLPLQGAKADSAGHSLLLLGITSFLLAGVYFGVQLWNKPKGQRPGVPAPSIEVLGTRRLGPRQELMIVRALGSDHLLLCTGGRAERVASTPSPVLALPAEASPETPPPPSQAGGIGLISRLSSQHRLNKLLDSMEHESDGTEEREHTGTFGAELYSATRASKRPSLHPLPAPGRRQSEAVAGITRLRQRTHS